MKNLFPILIFCLSLVACQPESEERVIPSSLQEKRAMLKDLKTESREISQLIKQIEEQIEKEDPKNEIIPVVLTDTLSKATFERFSTVQASIEADDAINASSETGGRVVSLNVKEGDQVRGGQLIAKIGMETLALQLVELETSLNLATIVFEKQQRLWDQKIGSEIQFLEAKNNKERIEKSIATLKSNLNKQNVYAPISGIIDMVMVNQGEMASPGFPIVQILNTRKVKVVAEVPENLLGKVNKGEKIKIYLPALDLELNEKVSMVGRKINPNNRTFKVEINTSNKSNSLKPNLLAEVYINDLTEKDVVTVPIKLLKEEVNGRKYVFIAEKKDKATFAKKVYIETGESNENEIIILDGLIGNEIILTNLSDDIDNGTKIQIAKS